MFHITGVPEHFNYPWHYAIEQGYFKTAGLEVIWHDNRSGTGAITGMLNNEETDIAVVLTEGMVADIARGGTSRIVQVFVKSPLVWGIHVAPESDILHKFSIKGKKFAISRKGSWSHLMAFILAEQLGYLPAEEDFVVTHDFDGAVNALNSGTAEVFLWEKYMSMPCIDRGMMKRVGEIPTPWPGFVIAAGKKTYETRENELRLLLKVIRTASGDFMTHPDSFELIAGKYGLKKDKMYEWFQITEWETTGPIHVEVLNSAVQSLFKVGIIGHINEPHTFCAPWCHVI